MKKAFIFGATILLSGCTCLPWNCEKSDAAGQMPDAAEIQPSTVGCAEPAPTRCAQQAILRPRVTETKASKNKRPCCNDKPYNQCDEYETYVPDIPELYSVCANRTVNTMLVEADAFFKKAGNIKVWMDVEYPRSADLPGGMDKGTLTLKKRFEQMPTVTVVDKKEQADYIVGSKADWYDTATKTVPAIKYDLYLKKPDGSTFGVWSEIIHQTEGDKSWW